MTETLGSPDGFEISAEVRLFPQSGGGGAFEDFTFQEITLGESLLTPGLQTSVTCHSYIHNYKNFDALKKGNVVIELFSPLLNQGLDVSQTIYRLENRRPLNFNNEQMTFRACDPTLLFDAETLVSKSWKCTSPSDVVNYVLRTCLGARSVRVEQSGLPRDYIAENIHPFQVIAQQSNVALANGNDPSFIHYMTYENFGTHRFESLYSLTKQRPVFTFTNSESGSNKSYSDPKSILAHSFPCDFDLLSDVLNGIDEKGKDISSLIVFNPLNKMFSQLGENRGSCGTGGGNVKLAQTNRNTAQNQNSCNNEVEKWLKKRQARMGLLEKNKIALRLTVPWNPALHAGKVIEVELTNKDEKGRLNYGSGTYLILHMTHNVKRGGLAYTTMDCVSTTVGTGVV